MSGYLLVRSEALTAVPLGDLTGAEWAEVRRHGLPQGFHYVVTVDGHAIVEPILLYLRAKCSGGRIRAVGNTQKTYCKDIYEWFSHLDAAGMRWDEVSNADIRAYRDMLLGLGRAVSTVRKRLMVMSDFYSWARRAGLYAGELHVREARAIPRDYSRDPLAHTRRGEHSIQVNSDLPRAYEHDRVDAMTMDEVKLVFDRLGSRIGTIGDPRPSRDRIASELALATGMRIHEVVALTVPQVLGMVLDPHYRNCRLPLVVTKGLTKRTVVVPESIYADLLEYIGTEREVALQGTGSEALALFVNSVDGNRNRGGSLTEHSLARNFHRAVVESGLTRTEMVPGMDGMERRVVAKHTFHDLRHTFAIVYYFESKRQGLAEPWVTLQRLLGHRHLSTTINTYLRSVSTREAQMTDAISGYLRALRDGQD